MTGYGFINMLARGIMAYTNIGFAAKSSGVYIIRVNAVDKMFYV